MITFHGSLGLTTEATHWHCILYASYSDAILWKITMIYNNFPQKQQFHENIHWFVFCHCTPKISPQIIYRSSNNIFIFYYILVHKFEIIYYFNYSKFHFFFHSLSLYFYLPCLPITLSLHTSAANCMYLIFAWKPTTKKETNFALLCLKVYKIFLILVHRPVFIPFIAPSYLERYL